MTSRVQMRRSDTPGEIPDLLLTGELAVNLPDRRLYVGDMDGTVIDFFSPLMIDDLVVKNTVRAGSGVFVGPDLSFGMHYTPTVNYLGWGGGFFDAFELSSGRRIWAGPGGTDLLELSSAGDLTAAGTLIVEHDISSRTGNITSAHAIIGDHIFAYRAGFGYGGVVGSWDTTTGKGAGFRLNASTSPALMEFGPADVGAGSLTSVPLTLSAAGDLSMAGTLFVGTSFALAGPANLQGVVAMHAGLTIDAGDLDMAGNLVVGSSFALAGAADLEGFVSMHAGLRLNGISPYTDNAAAILAGRVTGDVYFNTTVGALSVVVGAP